MDVYRPQKVLRHAIPILTKDNVLLIGGVKRKTTEPSAHIRRFSFRFTKLKAMTSLPKARNRAAGGDAPANASGKFQIINRRIRCVAHADGEALSEGGHQMLFIQQCSNREKVVPATPYDPAGRNLEIEAEQHMDNNAKRTAREVHRRILEACLRLALRHEQAMQKTSAILLRQSVERCIVQRNRPSATHHYRLFVDRALEEGLDNSSLPFESTFRRRLKQAKLGLIHAS